MTLKGWFATVTLVMVMPSAAHTATEANFDAKSTGDLVEVCSATPDNGMGTAALNFCAGYMQGAVTVEMLNMAAFRGPKLFCLPNPPPTRTQVMGEFVNWARAAPDRITQTATDGLFRFLRRVAPGAGR
jgi:hypothetical protein